VSFLIKRENKYGHFSKSFEYVKENYLVEIDGNQTVRIEDNGR
jgi:hypothetical protein